MAFKKEIWWGNGSIFNDVYFFLEKERLNHQKTKKETDFVLKTLNLRSGARILDLNCGWGRHAIELARRGFDVVGLDYNDFFLKKAQEEAKKNNLKILFIKGDMREFSFIKKFDAVINMGSSFGYFERDSENEKVLSDIAQVLKKNGKFLLDIRNRENFIRYYGDKFEYKEKLKENGFISSKQTFDFSKGAILEKRVIFYKGKSLQGNIFLRQYTLKELISMFERQGLCFVKNYGDYKMSVFTTKSKRCIIIGKKLTK